MAGFFYFVKLMKHLTLFLCVTFSLSFAHAKAQLKDTSRVDLVLLQKKQKLNQNIRDSIQWSSPDTSLNKFHYHYPSFWNLNSFLGYLGTPVHQTVYTNPNYSGVIADLDRLDPYRLSSSNTEFYQLTKPMTQAFYVWSTRREEYFKLSHRQNLSESLNIGAEYQRISNQGWFQRQILTFNGVNLNANFLSPSKRYAFKASASYNNNLSQENGGYSEIDEFTGEIVRFNNAESKSRTQEFLFSQSFKLGPLIIDTVFNSINDSLQDTIINKTIRAKHLFTHSMRFQRNIYEFQDSIPDLNSYLGAYSSNVTDAQDLIIGENQFEWQPYLKSKRIEFKLNLLNQIFSLDQSTGLAVNQWINTHIRPSLQFNFNPMLLNFKLDYGLTGYTSNDIRVKSNLIYQINKTWDLAAFVDFDSYAPNYFLTRYAQSQFNWNNSLPKTEELKAGLALKNVAGDSIELSYRLINDYNFLNESLRPETFNQEISLLQTKVSKHFRLRDFHIRLGGVLQISDFAQILGIPELVGFGSFYYEHTLFKKNMVTRFGTDVFTSSSYQPYSFYPLMRSFYQQSSFQTEVYPVIDVYFACQVKTARVFVKGTNLYQAISGDNYLLVDGYPLNPFSLRIGFNWFFMN